MDQKISTTELTRLAMTALSMSMKGNAAKAAGAAEGQFQKLLEQRAKPAEKPAAKSEVKSPEKQPGDKPAEDAAAGVGNKQEDQETVEQPAEEGVNQTEAKGEQVEVKETDVLLEQLPVEDPVEQVKRLAEMGAAFCQPDENFTWIDGDLKTGEIFGVYGPDEYIVAVTDGEKVNIPIVDLEPRQLEQIQQIVGDLKQLAEVEDPETDAMLEATDPTVDHSPAKLLEKVVDDQAGEVIEQVTEEVVAPQEDEDIQVELVDVEQGPKQVFQDVKAPPVKVGETYDAPQQAQDVNEQVAAQVIPALEQGQTKVELQLTPEHLGSVKVEITQSENGTLHVAITAQSSQTRNLLEKSADSLQSLLASRSQSTVRVEVQRQEESQPQQQSYDGHNSQHQQQEQQHQHRHHSAGNSQDFLHQLRLGLVSETWEGD